MRGPKEVVNSKQMPLNNLVNNLTPFIPFSFLFFFLFTILFTLFWLVLLLDQNCSLIGNVHTYVDSGKKEKRFYFNSLKLK